jgi:hypothetical protein
LVSGYPVVLAMIGRRSFIAGILGAAAAPAIVKSESLMKIVVPQQRLYAGELGVVSDGFGMRGWISLDRYASEMLHWRAKHLRMTSFCAPHPIPEPSGKTVKFRRYAGPILVPSNPLNDLLGGERKTS